jgi:hypothetical protein
VHPWYDVAKMVFYLCDPPKTHIHSVIMNKILSKSHLRNTAKKQKQKQKQNTTKLTSKTRKV